jgi:hypothetical protein
MALRWMAERSDFCDIAVNYGERLTWCAVPTYVLIAIVKKELQLDASLYTLLQILSVSVFEKTPIFSAFRPDDQGMAQPANDKQLNLFGL